MTRPWSYWPSPAARSDPSAWTEIVERYAQVVWSICTWFQLSNHDYEDVSTTRQRKCLRGVTAARSSDDWGRGWTMRRSSWMTQGSTRRSSSPSGKRAAGGVHRGAALPPTSAGHAAERPAVLVRGGGRDTAHSGRQHRPTAPVALERMQVPALVAVGKGDIGFGIPGGGAGA